MSLSLFRPSRFSRAFAGASLICALLACAPAAFSLQSKRYTPPEPLPNSIDTSIMSTGAAQSGRLPYITGQNKLAIRGIYSSSLTTSVEYLCGSNTSAATATLSIATLGLDVGIRGYGNNLSGFGTTISYALGDARVHYSAALRHAIQYNVQGHSARGVHQPLFETQGKTDAKDLKTTLVRYTRGLQSNVYLTEDALSQIGMYSSEGGAIGKLYPIGHTGVTLSGLAQAIQFNPTGGSGRESRFYAADVQYGISVVWQDQINGFDGPKNPIIRPWNWKIGADYFSKAFGEADAVPETYDVYVRGKIRVSVNHWFFEVEIKPLYGWGDTGQPGQSRRSYYGGDLALSFPLAL